MHGPKGECSTEAFDVIIDLLKEQEETSSSHLEQIEYVEKKSNNKTLKDFFSFRLLISLQIIEVLYIIGAVGITVVSWNVFLRERLLLGILTIIVGNLVWRLTCETITTFFHINAKLHQLSLIHQELKRIK